MAYLLEQTNPVLANGYQATVFKFLTCIAHTAAVPKQKKTGRLQEESQSMHVAVHAVWEEACAAMNPEGETHYGEQRLQQSPETFHSALLLQILHHPMPIEIEHLE